MDEEEFRSRAGKLSSAINALINKSVDDEGTTLGVILAAIGNSATAALMETDNPKAEVKDWCRILDQAVDLSLADKVKERVSAALGDIIAMPRQRRAH